VSAVGTGVALPVFRAVTVKVFVSIRTRRNYHPDRHRRTARGGERRATTIGSRSEKRVEIGFKASLPSDIVE